MEIKNETDARQLLGSCDSLPLPRQKREINLAIERIELNLMYYEQKGNDRAAARMNRCIAILAQYLEGLE